MDLAQFEKLVVNFSKTVEKWESMELSPEDREKTRIQFRNVVLIMEIELIGIKKILQKFKKS